MLIILHNPWNAKTMAHVKTPVSSGQGLREHGSAQREPTSVSSPPSLPLSPSRSKRPQIYNQSLRNFIIRARIRYTAARMMRRQTNSADAQNQRERLFFFFFFFLFFRWGRERETSEAGDTSAAAIFIPFQTCPSEATELRGHIGDALTEPEPRAEVGPAGAI